MRELFSEHCSDGAAKLSESEASELSKTVPKWKLSGIDSLSCDYEFPDFLKAFEFLGKVVPIAESENHHPDIEFGWGRASITFTTHSASGVTRNDFIMAAKIDRLG